MTQIYEVHPPTFVSSAKLLTSIDDRAKDGYGWHGEFLRARTGDYAEGDIVQTLDNTVGSRNYPSKKAQLYVMTAGRWVEFAACQQDEWAFKLRDVGRLVLEVDAAARPSLIKTALAAFVGDDAKVRVPGANMSTGADDRKKFLARLQDVLVSTDHSEVPPTPPEPAPIERVLALMRELGVTVEQLQAAQEVASC